MNRHRDLVRFYSILDLLEEKTNGKRFLKDCSGRMQWPERGVYFFFENGEVRSDSGSGLRVVRVGTHALKDRSSTSLWNRLSQHKGQVKSGGGNHRGSIFRLITGTALITKYPELNIPTWGKGNTADRKTREGEHVLEVKVSEKIGDMPFLWLDIKDEPGPRSQRGIIERNSIALLSNCAQNTLDAPSSNWLGQYCDRERVRCSGLWNQNHVEEQYDPRYLDLLEHLVLNMGVVK